MNPMNILKMMAVEKNYLPMHLIFIHLLFVIKKGKGNKGNKILIQTTKITTITKKMKVSKIEISTIDQVQKINKDIQQ